jgi:hypothetical protein
MVAPPAERDDWLNEIAASPREMTVLAPTQLGNRRHP